MLVSELLLAYQCLAEMPDWGRFVSQHGGGGPNATRLTVGQQLLLLATTASSCVAFTLSYFT